jgi:hypothetical protein
VLISGSACVSVMSMTKYLWWIIGAEVSLVAAGAWYFLGTDQFFPGFIYCTVVCVISTPLLILVALKSKEKQ